MDLDIDNSSDDTGSSSNIDPSTLLSGLTSLPVSIAGIVTFFEKSAVLSAIESLFGAGVLATAVTEALWVVGIIITGIIGTLVFLTVFALMTALVKRSPKHLAISAVGGLWIGASYAVSQHLFTSLPVVAGFVLASNLLIYGGFVLALALFSAAAISLV